jgi:hypothetical protein
MVLENATPSAGQGIYRGGWGMLTWALFCGMLLGGIMLAIFLWVDHDFNRRGPSAPTNPAVAPP